MSNKFVYKKRVYKGLLPLLTHVLEKNDDKIQTTDYVSRQNREFRISLAEKTHISARIACRKCVLHFCTAWLMYIIKPLNARLPTLGNSVNTRWRQDGRRKCFPLYRICIAFIHVFFLKLLSNGQTLWKINKSSQINFFSKLN